MVGYETYRIRSSAITRCFEIIRTEIFQDFDDYQLDEVCLRWEQLVELQIYLCYLANKVELEDDFAINLQKVLEVLSAGMRRNFFVRRHNLYVDYTTTKDYIQFFFI